MHWWRQAERSWIAGCGANKLTNQRKERKNTTFTNEIRAGLATFFAMAYIISVNASIVSQSGGPCVCPPESMGDLCDTNVEYMQCVQEVKRDIVTATAAISALVTFCMGLFANMPIGLATGMGTNAYFAYTVVGYHGSGLIPYKIALAAVFVEGFVFVGLTWLGIRQWLARAIPASIKLATAVGIGLYLTLIGMTYSAGIGLITGADATPIELAGCHPAMKDPETGLCPSSDKMRNPTLWLGIFCGGVFTVMLMMYRVKGAIIAGILLVSIISWPRNSPVTYFPHTPLGDDGFNFFKQVVTFHPIKHTLNVIDFNMSEHAGQFGLAFISFLYVDILDATGTLYAMARFGGFLNKRTQDFENSTVAYTVDALGISIGSVLGVPPVTAFVESGAGISEGGRTGITAMTTGFCFFIAVFFAPIFASFPPWATGCTLIIVGAQMAAEARFINWKYFGDSIPAFLTIVMMPFTYSIAYGLIAGIMSYILINTLVWVIEKVTRGKIRPPNKDEKEPWTYKIEGGFFPPWAVRLAKGQKHFWSDKYDTDTDSYASDGESETSTPAESSTQHKTEKRDLAADESDKASEPPSPSGLRPIPQERVEPTLESEKVVV